MSPTFCDRCQGNGEIEYDRGDDCAPKIVSCPSCAGSGRVIAPRDPRLDARMLADLRAWRFNPPRVGPHGANALLGMDELDLLLAVADERDALKRAACAMPDEKRARSAIAIKADVAHLATAVGFHPDERDEGSPTSPDEMRAPSRVEIRAAEIRADELARVVLCGHCATRIRMLGGVWLHVNASQAVTHRAAPSA